MVLFRPKLIVAVIATLNLFEFTDAQDLTAVQCQAWLKSGRHSVSTVYDEDDTVYIFGGFSQPSYSYQRDVFKYSVSQDTIEHVGSVPERSVGGSTIMDKHKNIFHFGTYSSSNIFQYFPDIQNFTTVSSLPSSSGYFTTIKVDEDTALLFGGNLEYNRVLSLDLNSLQYNRLPDLPQALIGYSLSVVWVEEKGEAYIFKRDGVLGKFNRVSGEYLILPNFFPWDWGDAAAVWDGDFGYLVGGFGNQVPSETIIQFDPDTEAVRFIRVIGLPGGNTSTKFSHTSAVYVEKLNRIYMFGGLSRTSSSSISHNGIWYISLDPLKPPTQTPTTEDPTTDVPPTPTTEEPTPETTTENAESTTEHSGSTTTPRPPHLCPVDDPMEPPNDQCDPDEPFPTYLPYPYDCTKFFQCANGMAICQRCSNGTIWSQEDKVCVRNGTIPCDPPTTTPRPLVNEYSIINFVKKYFF